MEPKDFVEWLEKQKQRATGMGGERYPEFVIADLIDEFKKDWAL